MKKVFSVVMAFVLSVAMTYANSYPVTYPVDAREYTLIKTFASDVYNDTSFRDRIEKAVKYHLWTKKWR